MYIKREGRDTLTLQMMMTTMMIHLLGTGTMEPLCEFGGMMTACLLPLRAGDTETANNKKGRKFHRLQPPTKISDQFLVRVNMRIATESMKKCSRNV